MKQETTTTNAGTLTRTEIATALRLSEFQTRNALARAGIAAVGHSGRELLYPADSISRIASRRVPSAEVAR